MTADVPPLHAAANDPENPLRAKILDTAKKLTSGSRGRTYGDAKDDFGRTAVMWSQVFGIPVTASEVAICLALVKVSRLVQTPNHEDSWVDACGYMALGGEIEINRFMKAVEGQ